MTIKKQRQFAIYSRKSRFTGKGESVENQIEMCRQYIATHYSREEAETAFVYEDEGFSGGTLERPQFQKMMDDAKKTRFYAIVVYRLDRISRNIGDFAELIEQLNDMEIDFISMKEQFDTSNPMGRAMMYISSVFSQLERETIAERIRDNMHELSKTGRWLGGTTPTGYESESSSYITVDGKTKKACKLKSIPEEIQLVKRIYDKFLETGSLTKTDAFLMENQYTTKRGNRFTRFTIRSILSNPVYMIADEDAYQYLMQNEVDLFAERIDFDGEHGIMAYNRTLQRQGKAHQIQPMNAWIVSIGKHEGVISGAKWVQVQHLLERNKSKSYRRPRSNVALLSGLLYCGNCGDYMRPKLSTRQNASGERIYTYLCSTKERSRSHCCAINNVNGNILDARIILEVKRLGSDGLEFVRQLEQSKRVLDWNQESENAEVEKLRAQIESNEEEISGLIHTLTKISGTAAEMYIIQQIDALHKKGQHLKACLKVQESITAEQELPKTEFDAIRQLLSTFGQTVDEMSVEQKRAAIRAFVHKVVWDGQRVHIYLYGSDDNDGF